MAANNAGRAGGGGAGAAAGGNNPGVNNEHVEFSVKAEEDLFLTGAEHTLKRVTAETNYSCLMLKTQRFSSLFRHYAKYHGLRKDDLEYYFVNVLENEDTPETVQLQRGDTIMVCTTSMCAVVRRVFVKSFEFILSSILIWSCAFFIQVRKRRKPEPPEAVADDDGFITDMKALLDDTEHMDAVFLVHTDDSKGADSNDMNDGVVEIRAHKSVLTARAEYFKALFRTAAPGGSAFSESTACTVTVEPAFRPIHIRTVLEFIYTNRVTDLQRLSTDDLLAVLHLSDTWLLRDLKRLCEHEMIRAHVKITSVARLYCATEDVGAQRLSRACISFIMAHLRELAGNPTFIAEMQAYPHLCIPVLKAAADLIPESATSVGGGPLHKKQRTGEHGSTSQGTPIAGSSAFRSSPVPDSDT
jgi:speckle-type POZ protein